MDQSLDEAILALKKRAIHLTPMNGAFPHSPLASPLNSRRSGSPARSSMRSTDGRSVRDATWDYAGDGDTGRKSESHRRQHDRHLTLPAQGSEGSSSPCRGGRSTPLSKTGGTLVFAKTMPGGFLAPVPLAREDCKASPTHRSSTSVGSSRQGSKQRLTVPSVPSHIVQRKEGAERKRMTTSNWTLPDPASDDCVLSQSETGVKNGGSPAASRKGSKQSAHNVVNLALTLHMPFEDLSTSIRIFKRFAGYTEGCDFMELSLTKEQFAKALHEISDVSEADHISQEIVTGAFRTADRDHDGTISFEEFAIWFSAHYFNEELMLDKGSLEVRRLARKLHLSVIDAERYKCTFDKFDDDGNGLLDFDEFYTLLHKLLKTREGVELPAERVHNLWRSADSDSRGGIYFEDFVPFYMRYFDDREGQSNPEEEFYHVRKMNTVLQDD